MKYETEEEIFDVVEKFENGSISRDDWGHPEHLIVGFYYVKNNEFDVAVHKMRNGIFNLLRAFKVDLTKEMPYHETLTFFWMKTIYEFYEPRKNVTTTEFVSAMLEEFDKDYPLNFYSREVLFSDVARKKYVLPK